MPKLSNPADGSALRQCAWGRCAEQPVRRINRQKRGGGARPRAGKGRERRAACVRGHTAARATQRRNIPRRERRAASHLSRRAGFCEVPRRRAGAASGPRVESHWQRSSIDGDRREYGGELAAPRKLARNYKLSMGSSLSF